MDDDSKIAIIYPRIFLLLCAFLLIVESMMSFVDIILVTNNLSIYALFMDFKPAA